MINVKSSGQEGPNPTEENLQQLKETVAANKKPGLVVGFSNDGDADRFGVIDEKGNFISTNDVLLLVSHHLADNKGIKGAIVTSQSTSVQLDKIAEKHGLDVYETPVGFKYLGSDILKVRNEGSDILIAGEESGGLTVNGHIPEKDGIIALSLIMDLIATEKKPLSKIISDLKSDLGGFYEVQSISKKFDNDEAKNKIMKKAELMFDKAMNGDTDFFGTHKIDIEKSRACKQRMETYKPGGDGYKFILTDGSSVLMRKSGTEPMVRCRIEAAGKTPEEAKSNYNILADDLSDFFTL
jgi:phosphomannomutase